MDSDEVVLAADMPPATIDRMMRREELTRIASGIYLRATGESTEQAVKRLWPQIAGRVFPDAVISDRSAPTGGPRDGTLYLVHDRRRDRVVELPGMVIVATAGAKPEPDDIVLPTGLRLASRGRALAENARESRARSRVGRRTLGDTELADWVDDLARTDGLDRLKSYRDRADELAEAVGASSRKMGVLRRAVGAALGTKTLKSKSRALTARQTGCPFDRTRIERFELVADRLLRAAPQYRPLDEHGGDYYKYEPFFEAYFSNYIEGTEFTLDEARSIVFDDNLPYERSADGHDLLGTYRLVADPDEMISVPDSADDFVELLRYRNSVIMAGRPSKRPGQFKQFANRAGETQFVDPDLVNGTLREGFRSLERLDTAWQRAVLMMLIAAEVHPFADGNGRTARVMMNAELQAAGQSRIIVVTAFRTDYLDGLRALSRRNDPSILISAMRIAQDFTASIDFADFDNARERLDEARAFDESAVVRRLVPAYLPIGSQDRV